MASYTAIGGGVEVLRSEKGGWGDVLSRVTEHVLVELRAGGFIEHMADQGSGAGREFDKLWEGVTQCVCYEALKEAASTPKAEERAEECERYGA